MTEFYTEFYRRISIPLIFLLLMVCPAVIGGMVVVGLMIREYGVCALFQ